MPEQEITDQAPSNETLSELGESSRRTFLRNAALASAGVAGLGILPAVADANFGRHGFPFGHRRHHHQPPPQPAPGLTQGDIDILVAAEIAEALAVTTYSNIINTAPFFGHLEDDDQGYLEAALQEEMSHYLLEQGASGKPSPFSTFYYPPKMFADAQTTLNVLVTLEDAFIAAYLVGVRNFSTADLRVTAARIMGIESDHRTLARVVGPGVATADGGPIELITGVQGTAESVDPPNNNGYERTLLWTDISQAVTALTPFADPTAAKAAGFDVTKPYTFTPFTPTVPNPLGDFHSFAG
jgi:Ferritin-like domain